MKGVVVNVLLGLTLTVLAGIAYKNVSKSSVTYSGQCGPVLFDYAKLEFSGTTGEVTAIEKEGQKIRISAIPCIYREDK